MQLLKTLSTLAVASTVVAVPAPAHELDKRAGTDPDATWSIVGWGNPGCKGTPVWSKSGSKAGCHDTQILAASYRWAVTRHVSITSLGEPDFCTADVAAVFSRVTFNTVGNPSGSGHWVDGCEDSPIMSFGILILD